MIKKITAFSLACILGVDSRIAFSSCKNQYTKTPKDILLRRMIMTYQNMLLSDMYKGVEYTPYKITAESRRLEQIENKLAEELKEYSTVEVISDRPAKLGDTLTINYAGTIDGEAFEGGTATEQTITLGQAGYIVWLRGRSCRTKCR